MKSWPMLKGGGYGAITAARMPRLGVVAAERSASRATTYSASRPASATSIDVKPKVKVRLADGAPFRSWLPPGGVPARDETSRWRCVLAALNLAERVEGAPDSVRAIEGRATVDTLRDALMAAGPPRPNTSMLGSAFSAALDTWVDSLAAAIGTQSVATRAGA